MVVLQGNMKKESLTLFCFVRQSRSKRFREIPRNRKFRPRVQKAEDANPLYFALPGKIMLPTFVSHLLNTLYMAQRFEGIIISLALEQKDN